MIIFEKSKKEVIFQSAFSLFISFYTASLQRRFLVKRASPAPAIFFNVCDVFIFHVDLLGGIVGGPLRLIV